MAQGTTLAQLRKRSKKFAKIMGTLLEALIADSTFFAQVSIKPRPFDQDSEIMEDVSNFGDAKNESGIRSMLSIIKYFGLPSLPLICILMFQIFHQKHR